MITDYEKQAADFLEQTGTKLDVVYLYTGPYFYDDTEHRDIYAFTLANVRGVYSAKFGDSIRNTQRRAFVKDNGHFTYRLDPRAEKQARKLGFKVTAQGGLNSKEVRETRQSKPTAYDILAALSGYDPGTFRDFCDSYGYDVDNIRARDIYQAVQDEWDGLRRLFTPDQLEQLAEIQ